MVMLRTGLESQYHTGSAGLAGRYAQAKSEIIEATQYQKKLLVLLPSRADLRPTISV
jgi:hypothetical protein